MAKHEHLWSLAEWESGFRSVRVTKAESHSVSLATFICVCGAMRCVEYGIDSNIGKEHQYKPKKVKD